MAKYIEFGFRNKKLLLPFGVALLQIIINALDMVIAEPAKNPILDMIVTGLSEISMPLIHYLNISSLKHQTNNDNKHRYPWKTKILHFFILFFIFAVYVILNIFVSIQGNLYRQNNKNIQNPHNSGFSCLESLEMIFICLVSIFLLKYKYFRHHIISIIIFILLCISIDLILDNFPYIYDRGVLFIVISIILVILDAIDYGYQKYMMDVLFYPFWSIALIIGIVNLIIFGLILIICLFTGEENSNKEKNFLFIAFYHYFSVVKVGLILTKQLVLNYILTFFLNLLRVLTILYFTPDYILISFAISRIVNVVIETKKYICLALFPLQFFVLMFYLEIIELKFCGLNKNTRKNIQIRGEREINKNISDISGRMSDLSSRSSNASDIEVTPDYFIGQSPDFYKNGDFNQYYELNEKLEE